MKRILFVSPPRGTLPNADRERPASDALPLPLASMPPLELATLAAMTPSEFEVDIWDESVRNAIDEDTDLGKDYDLIGVTACMPHIPWALNIASIARARGIPVAIGGPGVSGAPDVCRGLFDVLFIGEAELTWPTFLEEWSKGTHRREYRQIQRPDINDSPAPRWDAFENMPRDYLVGPVQTTRGCPFDCEFCDVIYLFGREPRHKAVRTVLAEVAALEKLGMRAVFFCDDNFIGRFGYVKKLLRGLIELNNSFERPMRFLTQLSINLAQDDELLELMADANFQQVSVGIESPREASLREANKRQNYKRILVDDVRKIQSYGIFVKAQMIVGFDHDDMDIFDETYDFLREASITNAAITMLRAYPGTPLMMRLAREHRVIDAGTEIYTDVLDSWVGYKALTNIIPKQMTRVELFRNTLRVCQRVYTWEYFGACAKEIVKGIRRIPKVEEKAPPDLARGQGVRRAIENLAPEARMIVLDVLATVRESAPWMMGRMVSTMFRFAGMLAVWPKMREVLERRIAVESADGFRHRVVRMPPTLPPGFKDKMQRTPFQKTHEWLMEGMEDKGIVAQGLIEVWKAFLIRWGSSFEEFEDYHMQYLQELCERTIKRGNAGDYVECRVNAVVDGLAGVRLRRLAGEVLVSVEQDLRGKAERQTVHQMGE